MPPLVPRPVAVHDAIRQAAQSHRLLAGVCARLAEASQANEVQTHRAVLEELSHMTSPVERLRVLFHMAVAGTALPNIDLQSASAETLLDYMQANKDDRMDYAALLLLLAHDIPERRWALDAAKHLEATLIASPESHDVVLKIACEWCLPGSIEKLNAILLRTLPETMTPAMATALSRYLSMVVASGYDASEFDAKLTKVASVLPIGEGSSLYVALSGLDTTNPERHSLIDARMLQARAALYAPDVPYDTLEEHWTGGGPRVPAYTSAHEAATAEVQAGVIAMADTLVDNAGAQDIEFVLTRIERYADMETAKACIGRIMTSLSRMSQAAPVPSDLWRRAMAIEARILEAHPEKRPHSADRPMSMQALRLTEMLQAANEEAQSSLVTPPARHI